MLYRIRYRIRYLTVDWTERNSPLHKGLVNVQHNRNWNLVRPNAQLGYLERQSTDNVSNKRYRMRYRI